MDAVGGHAACEGERVQQPERIVGEVGERSLDGLFQMNAPETALRRHPPVGTGFDEICGLRGANDVRGDARDT